MTRAALREGGFKARPARATACEEIAGHRRVNAAVCAVRPRRGCRIPLQAAGLSLPACVTVRRSPRDFVHRRPVVIPPQDRSGRQAHASLPLGGGAEKI